MIKNITGDLLEAKEKYIVHQTNCVSQGGAAGLAYYLFKKFTYANVYESRKTPDVPGTIIISGSGEDVGERYIVNLMGQLYPGGFENEFPEDSEITRRKFFHQGLIRLAKVPNLESVAFPFKIGCGIAGGNWEWYLGTITNFAKYIFDNQGAKTVIYQREGDV